MSLSEKILKIKTELESSLSKGTPMYTAIENELQVSNQNIDTLYTIKYYLERDMDSQTDKALAFINSILKVFGTEIDKVDSIKYFDNETLEVSQNTQELVLKDNLRKNSGVENSPIASARYENGNLLIGRKDVTLSSDGSVALAVKTNTQLRYYLETLMGRLNYLYDRNRANGLKDIFEQFINSNCFLGVDNILLVVGRKNSINKTISYTIFGEKFVEPLEDMDTVFCESKEVTYKDSYFEVWVI